MLAKSVFDQTVVCWGSDLGFDDHCRLDGGDATLLIGRKEAFVAPHRRRHTAGLPTPSDSGYCMLR